MDVLLSSAYLPPVEWFTKLIVGQQVWVEQWDHYVKQTYRNRCIIDSPNGSLALTVPVEKPAEGTKCLMKDLRLSHHGKWKHQHWQALEASYYNSPFFEYYADDFRKVYEREWVFLMDMNEALVHLCCQLADVDVSLGRTMSYEAHPCKNDCRDSIHPKRPWTDDPLFRPVPYYQVFSHKHGFQPNLSFVDLLFNMGPEALLVLHQSVRTENIEYN